MKMSGDRGRSSACDLAVSQSLMFICFICSKSIRQRIDELETYAKFKWEVKDTCLLAFTETWLIDTDQISVLILTRFGSSTTNPMARSLEITGKS